MHINQSGIFRVVQVIKSLGNNLTRIIDVACCYRCSVVSVCLSVCWSRLWGLQKRLSQSRCHLGCGLCVRNCALAGPSNPVTGRDTFCRSFLGVQMLAKLSSNLLRRTGGDHRGGSTQPGWRTFMMTCLRWILGYMRLEIWHKIGLSGDWCLCTVLCTRSGACYYWTGLDTWACLDLPTVDSLHLIH